MRISTEIHPIWERLSTSWLFKFHCKQTFCKCTQMEMNTMQSGNVNCIRKGRGWGLDLTLCSRNHMQAWTRSLRGVPSGLQRLAPTVGKQAEGDTTTSGSHKLWSVFWLSKQLWDRFRPNDEEVKIPHPLCWLFFDPISSFFMWEYPQPRCDGYFFLYSFKYLLLSWIVAW